MQLSVELRFVFKGLKVKGRFFQYSISTLKCTLLEISQKNIFQRTLSVAIVLTTSCHHGQHHGQQLSSTAKFNGV